MKKNTCVLLFLIFIICPNHGWSQTESTFEIKGKTRIVVGMNDVQERTVDADSILIDHLIIREFRKNGSLFTSSSYRFSGRSFSLSKLYTYRENRSLKLDGESRLYSPEGSLIYLQTYRADTLNAQTFFYEDGNRWALISGNQYVRNGLLVMWYPNGIPSFKGHYKNNLKDGFFQSYDENGTLLKEGTYKSGELIEGEPVVQDIVYEYPDTKATFEGGVGKLNDYLIEKTRDWPEIKQLDSSTRYNKNVSINIGKKGEILSIDFSGLPTEFSDLLLKALADLPAFNPATVEKVPVKSIEKFAFEMDTSGISLGLPYHFRIVTEKTATGQKGDVYFLVEEMPEFPGGDLGARKFIAQNLRYPVEAQERGIQGKVYVSFIVDESGKVCSISVAKSVHPILDEEAMRVVSEMPLWKPGYQKGEPVKVSYTIPITFLLQ